MDNLAKKFDNKQYPDRTFDQAHALTVHKSQGSTYTETFVDMNDLLEYYNIQRNILHYQGEWNTETEAIHLRITRQLRYVASSRAKKFTYFLTS
jgi:ATP-dependent exoDNAse (exonuclease V) alpha subunit